ncbi:unnamed protein product [Linum trigynum]|uniref:Uncharacterized protein n=1 Tax=Linum trigynum TaxID=586398 RepID=A0AAV2EP80_9ROSI
MDAQQLVPLPLDASPEPSSEGSTPTSGSGSSKTGLESVPKKQKVSCYKVAAAATRSPMVMVAAMVIKYHGRFVVLAFWEENQITGVCGNSGAASRILEREPIILFDYASVFNSCVMGRIIMFLGKGAKIVPKDFDLRKFLEA